MTAREWVKKKKIICIVLCMITVCHTAELPSYAAEVTIQATSSGVEVTPVFNVPNMSYEGHTVNISDDSMYRVNGELVEKDDAYSTGIVSVQFTVVDDDTVRIRRNGSKKYERSVIFNEPGSYVLLMVLTTSDEKEYSLRKRINIYDTPEVESVISGAAKQNRLQRIDFKNIQNPNYKTQNLTVNIYTADEKEQAEAHIIENGTITNRYSSSNHIKLRQPEYSVSENACFGYGSIEFMGMFEAETDIKYTITSVDIRGNKDTFDGKLKILPDMPPSAAIDTDKSYVREEGCDYAVITLNDASTTDGDSLKRSWYVRYEGETEYRPLQSEDGYTDMADGSGASVSFRKSGVGKFYIKLEVSDVWSEGTMDEYTSKCVRLSDVAECESEVINIAPHVSVGMHTMKDADVVVISDKKDDTTGIEEKFFESFVSKGIAPHFSSIEIDSSVAGSSESDSGTLSQTFQTSGPYGYNGTETSFEENLYAVDNSNIYYIDAVWSDPDSGWPQEPFTLTSKNAETGVANWNFIITSDTFALDTKKSYMYQDDTEKYLYITSGGRTLIMNKSTGQPTAILDGVAGEYNFVNDQAVFTYKSDGIYRMSLADGSFRRIWSGSLSGCVRRIAGKIVTYTRTAQGSVMKITLDPYDESVSTDYTGRLSSDLLTKYGTKLNDTQVLDVVGIDVNGRSIVQLNTAIYNDTYKSSVNSYAAAVQVYEADGSLLTEKVFSNGSYRMKVFPVTDNAGAFNYFGVSYDGHGDITEKVIGICSDYEVSAYTSNKNGDPAVYDRIIYSFELGGKVYITIGGLCTWIYNQTWSNGPTHGMPERCINFSFDISAKTSKAGDTLPAGCYSFSEYAKHSDIYNVIHTGKNSQYFGQAALENRVTKKYQTVYDILYRYVKQYLRTDEDTAYKVLLINSDTIYSKLGSTGIQKITEEAAACGYTLFTSYDIDDITDSVTENEAADHRYTSVSSADGSGKLSRSFQLDSDRTYYYEYNIKSKSKPENIMSVSHGLTSVLNDSTYDSSSYRVTGGEVEDFDDSILNSFFSYDKYTSSAGLYTSCRISSSSRGSNVAVSNSAMISFTIPEGKQGVLSFDYKTMNSSNPTAPNANYAEIDGVRWEEPIGELKNGSYTHPYILTSGKHTLKLCCGAYGSRMLIYTYIDNLKLAYVSSNASDENESADETTVSNGSGSYKVSGSFTTPGKVTRYREMKGVTRISGSAGYVGYTALDKTSDENSHILKVSIPAGKRALLSSVRLLSSVSDNRTVSYSMGSYGSVTYYGKQSYGNIVNSITTNWKYILPTLSGTNQFTSSFSSYRGTRATFGEIQMYIANSSNILVENHRCLKAKNSLGKETLFLGEDGYDGQTDIVFNVGNGKYDISDFNIYTLEDGKKIYIASDDFSTSDSISKWNGNAVEIKYRNDASDVEESDIQVFRKGQLVSFDIDYWDYEDDPSKQSFWRYTHTPLNDGEFEYASQILDSFGNIVSKKDIILNEPVTRFYQDGKYTVEHWQTDDTTRGTVDGGNVAYDKESNHVVITFYIGSIADAPWIRYIRTVPSDVTEGDPLVLEVGLDDADKETLKLKTEVYFNDEQIYDKVISEIKPTGDSYNAVKINDITDNALSGKYKVVCTVSDSKGAGMETYSFNVVVKGNIEGMVYHTDQWEENRKIEGRDRDTFWPGEKLMLKADTEGKPLEVTAWIEGEEDEIYALQPDEEGVYRGSIWKEDMMFRWGSSPVEKKIIFEALYKNDVIKISEYNIIFDNSRLYWNIHRIQGD